MPVYSTGSLPVRVLTNFPLNLLKADLFSSWICVFLKPCMPLVV